MAGWPLRQIGKIPSPLSGRNGADVEINVCTGRRFRMSGARCQGGFVLIAGGRYSLQQAWKMAL